MSTPVTKCEPKWLYNTDVSDKNLNKHYRRSIQYYKALFAAWPAWCAKDIQFKFIYMVERV